MCRYYRLRRLTTPPRGRSAPEVGVTVEYGECLAITCTGCHGPGFSGGPIPLAPPEFPKALNLTPGGELQGWTEEMFINTLRTGVIASGHQLDNQYMPWKQSSQMTDDELKAVFFCARSRPKHKATDSVASEFESTGRPAGLGSTFKL